MDYGRKSAVWMVRCAAAAAAALAFAQPALADTLPVTAYYVDPALPGYAYPGPDKAIIAIDVKASIGGTCGFATGGAPSGTVNAGQIDTTAWSQDVPFTVECTAPWRIAVSSQNGALKTNATGATGYATKAPYDVALNLPWNTGFGSGTVTANCPVAQIDQAAGSTACTFEGTASTTNGLLVQRSVGLSGSKMTLSAPAYAGTDVLVAGTYNDTLIVTISPAS